MRKKLYMKYRRRGWSQHGLYILLDVSLKTFIVCTQHPGGDASWSARSRWLLWVSAQYSIFVPFTLQDFIRAQRDANPVAYIKIMFVHPSHYRII